MSGFVQPVGRGTPERHLRDKTLEKYKAGPVLTAESKDARIQIQRQLSPAVCLWWSGGLSLTIHRCHLSKRAAHLSLVELPCVASGANWVCKGSWFLKVVALFP
ncbi:hypothetical protein EYF80_032735 [Liparis tanakae]|uniref:Uncharacterized protein n=1 Tax=Liparis tanakae TaxID=230148 RepID=A0A4Z2GWQ4_9TELE|nr:hypothetical protein EYF80_032735 [Liparis tanakae]